ncbi:MAG: glycosyltransferase [Actinomycetota bacterium]|nr:glycosyltransferase [Actinomycetota bacterium]
MRLLFVGNVCNFAYWFARWGRELGYETHALIERDTPYPRDFPQWEDPDYEPAAPPPWVHLYQAGTAVNRALHGYVDKELARTLDGFDRIHTLTPAAAIAVDTLRREQVHHTVGSFARTSSWWRGLPVRTAASPRRLPTVIRFRQAMARADRIVVSTAVDHWEVNASHYRNKTVSLPVAYDVDAAARHARPWGSQLSGGRLRFILPARHDWSLKGQDTVFRALASLSRTELARMEVVAFDWGVDRDRSRRLVQAMRLGDVVRFEPMLPKIALWSELSAPGVVVIDQVPNLEFAGGGIGGVARDAMAVGTPVITHARPDAQMRIHAAAPPVLHTECSSEAVVERVRQCLEMAPGDLDALGSKGRAWLREECHYTSVLPRLVELHFEAVGGRLGMSGHEMDVDTKGARPR